MIKEINQLVEDDFGVTCKNVAQFNFIDDIRDTSSYYKVYNDFYLKNKMIGISNTYTDCLID